MTRSLLSTNLRSGRSSPCSLRSASDTPGRRNHDRQPSPPLLPSSQAEGTNLKLSQPFARYAKNLASNSSDPFLTSSDSDSDHSRTLTVSSSAKATPSKLIYAHPSGKLARRNPTTPTPAARPVPVPRSNAPRNRLSLAHSAPSHSGVSLRQARFASAGAAAEFPIVMTPPTWRILLSLQRRLGRVRGRGGSAVVAPHRWRHRIAPISMALWALHHLPLPTIVECQAKVSSVCLSMRSCLFGTLPRDLNRSWIPRSLHQLGLASSELLKTSLGSLPVLFSRCPQPG
ncbi:hypothetical protein EDD16DRAFT_593990 [Pisolithus croceorrhizus]|nr:hypothetical protein EV401DRAFT_657524 [Pisolithus croceorrhizus]KAI6124069.1 hypothetical protein EDD16DRAFT_593990 [Pisolithus croceorrhizus]KAI6168515.1 hypothetical protein EDD17DRAFT_626962 [Pisolithus thermaeus]